MKVAIAGGPRTGKSTLAEEIQLKNGDTTQIFPTDMLLIQQMDWSKLSDQVSDWFKMEDFIIEGVAVPRALRKFIKKNPGMKPCDKIIYLTVAFECLSPRQNAMAKGVFTVWNEILPELKKLGVEIEYRDKEEVVK